MTHANPNHVPFYFNEAAGYVADYEDPRSVLQGEQARQDMLTLADINAKLAIADATERAVKAIIALNERVVEPF